VISLATKRKEPTPSKSTITALAAKEKCHILYDGSRTGHRSCGIAIAETFDVPTNSYQALRRGGLTGEGHCGAIEAGRLVLGELLGDASPTGPPTPALISAVSHYDEGWSKLEILKAEEGKRPNIVCNHLTGKFPIFKSPERHSMCTHIARDVAKLVADVLIEEGQPVNISPIDDVDDFDPQKPNPV